MNGAITVIGLVILAVGVSGILFVTIPSIENIGQQAVNLSNDNSTGKAIVHAGSAVLSGVILWFTTGLFIVAVIIGFIITIAGLVHR